MSFAHMALEYLLVYCTSHGLTSLGEPPLPKTYRPVGDSLIQTQRSPNHSTPTKGAMPVWIIFIFLSLATLKYIISFLLWYIYQIIATVTMVSSAPVNPLAAANAERHPLSDRARMDTLVRAMKTMRAFKTAKAKRLKLQNVSVTEVRNDLKRRSTLHHQQNPHHHQHPTPQSAHKVSKFWTYFSFPCFRGFTTHLTLSVCLWFLPVTIDFFLSGQPSELKLGYGSTTIVLFTLFGPGFAVWTHYAITARSQKRILDHFPRGRNVVLELWEITACWAVAEQVCVAGPLAVSRGLGLRRWAFDAESWNELDARGVGWVLAGFAGVFLLYLLLVASLSIPTTIVARRVYASMLSDEDLAVIPFHSGDRTRLHPYDDRATFRRPGLTVTEAFASVKWKEDYWRVVRVYVLYWVCNQAVQVVYWGGDWWLHGKLGVEGSVGTGLPCSPGGRVRGCGPPRPRAGVIGNGTMARGSHGEL